MTRKRPLCAECGKPLRVSNGGRGNILVRYGDVPGAPEVGWHWELCASGDDLAKVSIHGPGEDGTKLTLASVLLAIERRGKGRVTFCSDRAFREWIRAESKAGRA